MRNLKFLPAIWLLLSFCHSGTAGLILDEYVRATNPEQNVASISELDQAVSAFRERDYDRCLASLEQAHQRHPQLPPPRLMVAILFLDAGQPAAGRSILESIATVNRDNPLLYEVFGRIALAENRISDAELHFERELELLRRDSFRPAQQRTHFEKNCQLGLATVAEVRQDWKQASDRLSEVLKLDANDAAARQRLGRVTFQLGNEKQAFLHLAQAAQDDPKLESAAIAMSRLSTQRSDAASAEQWLKRAVDDSPNDVQAWIAYGNWLLDQGRVEEATQAARRAGQLDSTLPAARALSGLCARHEKRFEDAEKLFQQLQIDDPGEFQWTNQLALSLIEQPEEAKRKRSLQLAELNARQYPQLPDVQATLGWIYFRLGRPVDAQRSLDAAIANGHASSDTAFYLAHVKSDQKNLADVRALLSTALRTSGQFVHRQEAQEWLMRIPEAESNLVPENAAGRAPASAATAPNER